MGFTSALRHFVYLIAVMLIVIGMTLIVYGYLNFIALIDRVKVTHFLNNLGTISIVIGTIIFILGLTGIVGVSCRNTCLLKTFATAVIVSVIVELSAIVGVIYFYNEESISEELKSILPYYNEEKDIKKFWDSINENLECCGVDSIDDWGDNIPKSCCKDLNINDVCHKELANQTPCLPEMIRFLKEKIPIAFSIVFTLQVVCIFGAFTLSRF